MIMLLTKASRCPIEDHYSTFRSSIVPRSGKYIVRVQDTNSETAEVLHPSAPLFLWQSYEVPLRIKQKMHNAKDYKGNQLF